MSKLDIDGQYHTIYLLPIVIVSQKQFDALLVTESIVQITRKCCKIPVAHCISSTRIWNFCSVAHTIIILKQILSPFPDMSGLPHANGHKQTGSLHFAIILHIYLQPTPPHFNALNCENRTDSLTSLLPLPRFNGYCEVWVVISALDFFFIETRYTRYTNRRHWSLRISQK